MIVVRRGRPRQFVRRSSEIDDLFRAMMSSRSHNEWRPPLDVFETDASIEVVAEIAGLDGEQIDVTIGSDVISIRGHRPDPAICDHRSFHQARIAYGDFAVDVFVPIPVDSEQATASYQNGFLRISVPRSRPKTIVPTSTSGTSNSSQGPNRDRSHA